MNNKSKNILIIVGVISLLLITGIIKTLLIPKNNEIDVNKEPIANSEEDNQQAQEDPLDKDNKGVQNILVIGVDEGGYDSSRSDAMIIVTIDNDNKAIKLTSVMRDTLAYIPTSNTYQKLNHSYMEGGPKETMKAFNVNFDLDIENYVVFDYEAVKKVINFVGGYPVEVDSGEAKDMGIKPGHHVLKGDSAVDYMRVRYNSGGDTGRNQRQRDLIIYAMGEVKDMDKSDILKFASQLMPHIRTSYSFLDIKELTEIYSVMKNELSIEQYSFPFDYKGKILKDDLWYAVPRTMKTNVMDLQSYIYNSYNYSPSKNVSEISEVIENKSNVHLNH